MASLAGNLSCCFPLSAASYHAEDARLPHATQHYSPHLFPCSMTKLICDNKSASQISVLIWGGGVFPFDIDPGVFTRRIPLSEFVAPSALSAVKVSESGRMPDLSCRFYMTPEVWYVGQSMTNSVRVLSCLSCMGNCVLIRSKVGSFW